MRRISEILMVMALLFFVGGCSNDELLEPSVDEDIEQDDSEDDDTDAPYGALYSIDGVSANSFEVTLSINLEVQQEWAIAYKLYIDEGASSFKVDASFGEATYITESGTYSLSHELLHPQTNYTVALEAVKWIDYTYENEDGTQGLYQPYQVVGDVYTKSGVTPSATVGDSATTIEAEITSATSTTRTITLNNGFRDFIGCMVGCIKSDKLASDYSGDIEAYIADSGWLYSDDAVIVNFRSYSDSESYEIVTSHSYIVSSLEEYAEYTIFTVPITTEYLLGSVSIVD